MFNLNREPEIKYLNPYMDTRGYSFFNIYPDIKSGQINIGNLFDDAIKAFHYHKAQDDYWFCLKGNIHIICARPKNLSDYETGNLSKENCIIKHFYIGENNPCVLKIPIYWMHGYCNLNKDSTLLYWVTEPYNPNCPDEYRIDWDIFGKDIWRRENK